MHITKKFMKMNPPFWTGNQLVETIHQDGLATARLAPQVDTIFRHRCKQRLETSDFFLGFGKPGEGAKCGDLAPVRVNTAISQ